MKRGSRAIVTVVGVAVLVLGAGGASAQARRAPRANPPATPQGRPQYFHDPFLPNSLGLLERDYHYRPLAQPRPGYNFPTYQPGSQLYPPYYGGGYYYPNTYFQFGFGYPQYGYPNGYGQYGNGNVVEREVIIYQNGGAGQQYDPRQGNANGPTRRDPMPEARPAKPAGEDFYLKNNGEAESLNVALDDIRKAWLNGDFDRLQARIKTDGKLKIYLKGEYKYSVDGKDFAGMVKDAMARIDTMAFELDKPVSDEPGRAFVTGKHTFTGADKMKQTVFISYGLDRIAGKWKIVETGSSDGPVAEHKQ